jgi:hypothetical protein
MKIFVSSPLLETPERACPSIKRVVIFRNCATIVPVSLNDWDVFLTLEFVFLIKGDLN